MANPEVDLVGIAWAVPWERERTRRLVGLGYETGPSSNYRFLLGRPGWDLIVRPRLSGELPEIDRGLRIRRRAAMLGLALRAFRAERGRYPDPAAPDPLKELLDAKYLSRLPLDPHDETRGYGYRLARAAKDEQGEWVKNDQGERGEYLAPPSRSPGAPAPLGTERVDAAGRRFIHEGQPVVWSVGPDKVDNGGTQAPAGGFNGGPLFFDIPYIVRAAQARDAARPKFRERPVSP